ncbi:DNA polymerase III alpha subunit [Tenacibaculum phage Larrie]|nr:DNA polymerase III alpha subunit [Tenacibaculum phage Larrie]
MKVVKIKETTAPKLVNGTLPDIDSDFAGTDRADVKRYMEERFGIENVCSVGTFTTMKPKSILKDLSRIFSIDYTEANLISSIISQKDETMMDLINRSLEEPKLAGFFRRNSDIFYLMKPLLNQPKTQSIHACAMIVFPEVMPAVEWCPMRTQGGLLVSEWQGGEMDDAGFLKDDILGVRQLTKFGKILELIDKNGKVKPDIYNIPLDDREVYRYFSNGWNSDVFQFGSSGLTSYTKALKPFDINDLILSVAIYRPGAMENGYHERYIKCKNEGLPPEYLWGTEDISKETFGMLIYQEQVMAVFQKLGGLSMKEADDVRRAMGKKKLEVLLPWKERVKQGFFERNATEEQFNTVWDAVLEFAKYGFNKSHSAAYAITGYISQWLKVHYPIEFWTVALDLAKETEVPLFLSEIMQTGAIELSSVDINGSSISMESNQKEQVIYWGIGAVKGTGEETAEQIVKEREENGEYKSFSDFYHRHLFKGSKVKKQIIEGLIAAGAFDKLYGFKNNERKRFSLITRYRTYAKKKISNPARDIYTIGDVGFDWWWKKREKELTGLVFINFEEVAETLGIGQNIKFCSQLEFNTPQYRPIQRTFGGYVNEVKIGRSSRGRYARITVENNYKIFKVLVWSEEYNTFESEISKAEGSFIIFSGDLRYDEKYSKSNQFTLNSNSELTVM